MGGEARVCTQGELWGVEGRGFGGAAYRRGAVGTLVGGQPPEQARNTCCGAVHAATAASLFCAGAQLCMGIRGQRRCESIHPIQQASAGRL